ncbi:MAG: LytR C-terminal domain-containing protein, partial [Thermoleophilaceae bacterium]
AGRAKPQFPPGPAAARTAATGAGPAAAVGPAAATTAAARAVEAARADEDDERAAAESADDRGATDGTDDRPALSQGTVVHPPPSPLDEDSDDLQGPEGDLEEDSTELAAAYDEYDEDEDEEWEETGDDPPSPWEHWEETGDEPDALAVSPVGPRPAGPSVPAGPGGDTPARSSAGSSPSSQGILPPYSQSRPGAAAPPGDRRSRGVFASRGRAAGVIAAVALVLAAVAFGVTRLLVGGDDTAKKAPASGSSQPAPGAAAKKAPKKAGGVSPASVRVAVLNATTVPGLAAQIGDSVEKQGFRLGTVTNFNDQQRAESVVLYAPGAEREAAEVGRRLKISQREPIDAKSQGVAGDATVVIVTGQDKTQ